MINSVSMEPPKLLFICNANVNRSKTAEVLFKEEFETKSAGFYCEDTTQTNKINSNLMEWAEIIFVFEKDHLLQIKEQFPTVYSTKKIISLEVPDIYNFMSEALVDRLKWKISNSLTKSKHSPKNVIEYHELDEIDANTIKLIKNRLKL